MLKTLIFLYKSYDWENSPSEVTAGKAVNKSYCRIIWSDISVDWINWSHGLLCIWTDYQKMKTSNLIFLIRGPGIPRYVQSSTWTQKLPESSNFTTHLSQSYHTLLVHRLSQQILLSNQIVELIDQPDI